MPRREARQRPILAFELVEQGRDGAMRLGDRQGIPIIFVPGRQHRFEPQERLDREGRSAAFQGELDDMIAPQPGDQLAGDPRAMILPWSMMATRSQSRSASSM